MTGRMLFCRCAMMAALLAAFASCVSASGAQASDSPRIPAGGMASIATQRGGFFNPAGLISEIDGETPPGVDSELVHALFTWRGSEHYDIAPGPHVITLEHSLGKTTYIDHVNVNLIPNHSYVLIGTMPTRFMDTTKGINLKIPLTTYKADANPFANIPARALNAPVPPAATPKTYDGFLQQHPGLAPQDSSAN